MGECPLMGRWPAIAMAEARPMIHHRAPVYSEIFARVLEDLKYVFQTSGDALLFACSGTGVMEAAIANCFCAGDKSSSFGSTKNRCIPRWV